MIQILQTYLWRSYNSVTTDSQLLNTAIEIFVEIKHLGKLFTESTFTNFCLFTHKT